jgi:hypothetical protein
MFISGHKITTVQMQTLNNNNNRLQGWVKKPTNALINQCIGTQYSPTCFGTLNWHHQGVKYDPAEIGVQYRGKQRRIGASDDNGHISQQDRV